ncbi:sensor histidine kinase [Terriglobus roseus]|uniref:histidine kinase n=1 Tax=Terriglobus roseus TaxID=392734 RepID=A0A1G7I4T6_9BACT|nr:sensor histidine kinase [Terriglobus roseus]SDF07722.1 PAS domain S-box-containing protein [Terriglobus roseus]
MPIRPIPSSLTDDSHQSHLLDRVRLLAEIDEAARRLLSPEEIVLRSATLLGEFLRVNRCAFADVEEDEDTFNLTGNYLNDARTMVGRYAFHDFSLECLRCMRAGEPYVVYDTEEDWSTQAVLEAFRVPQVRSVICVSVKRGGVLLAAMSLHCKEPRVWTADEIALLQAVANRVWESIIRIRSDRRAIEAREVLNMALEAGHAGVFDWSIQDNQITWSPQLEALYGVPAGTFEGSFQDWQRRVVAEDAERVTNEINALMQTQQRDFGYDFRACLPDGTQRWLHGQARFLYAYDGTPLRMIGINVDIHERRQAELALLENEKLAAVGRLAASIAHEINNPLESITNLLYLSQHSDDITEIQHYLQTAEQELSRVSVISAQTLRFYKQSTAPRRVTVHELFESVISVLQGRLFKHGVQLEERWYAAQPVRCLDGEIRQVLANLITNAIDALPPNGGRLYLRSHEGQDGKERRGVYIVVADTGTGMPPIVQKRLFDAFFTTKGEAGNGLGLWVSKEIVDRHEAVLRLKSSQKPGSSGTVFRLFLPFTSAVV